MHELKRGVWVEVRMGHVRREGLQASRVDKHDVRGRPRVWIKIRTINSNFSGLKMRPARIDYRAYTFFIKNKAECPGIPCSVPLVQLAG